jgi:flavin reductase (DIM6/NTAB) family NADH-FMN oxidoreductase RutF
MTVVSESQQPDRIMRPAGDAEDVVPEMRRVFSRFATGITVVTAGRSMPRGMTANSFTSVSLDPPLALVCVKHNASVHDVILETQSFAVSMLSAHQERVARLFADHGRPRGELEFEAVDAHPGPYSGAPVLSGALAWLECKLAGVYDGGDHSIFIGEVQTLGRSTTEDPLLFYQGGFRQLESDVVLPNSA